MMRCEVLVLNANTSHRIDELKYRFFDEASSKSIAYVDHAY